MAAVWKPLDKGCHEELARRVSLCPKILLITPTVLCKASSIPGRLVCHMKGDIPRLLCVAVDNEVS